MFFSVVITFIKAPKNINNSVIDIVLTYNLWNNSPEYVIGLNNNSIYIINNTFLLLINYIIYEIKFIKNIKYILVKKEEYIKWIIIL